MLTLYVGQEEWNELTEEFMKPNQRLDLEHSLVSLSKWEQKFEKPFLGNQEKSDEEVMEYIRCMSLTPEFPPEDFSQLSQANLDAVNEYINAKATATWFVDETSNPRNSEVITSELIYYWMISFQIPWESQFWHLNRLFTLIRVCNVKNSKPKKLNRSEMLARRAQMNEQRRKQYNTSG